MTILTEKKTWRRFPSATEANRCWSTKLTSEQQQNVRRALVFLAARYGSPAATIRALGCGTASYWKLRGKARGKSVRLALAISRLAGVSIDDVISGRWPEECVCPYCGRG